MAYFWYFFSALHKNGLRESALRSQHRRYPGDWVFTYVEGDARLSILESILVSALFSNSTRPHKAEGFIPICADSMTQWAGCLDWVSKGQAHWPADPSV